MKIRNIWLMLPLLAFMFQAHESVLAGDRPDSPIMDIPCLPAAYLDIPKDCLLVGPAKVITQRAIINREIARQAEWLKPTADGLGETNYSYLKVKESRGRIFSSLTAAIAGKHPSKTLRNGFNYVTYIDTTSVDGKTYYQIGYNQWMRSGDIAKHIEPTDFSGVEVDSTPPRPFGWTLSYVYVFPTPKNSSNITGTLDRHSIIQVFETVTVDGYDWYLVGPDQWIEQRMVALVFPRSEAPEGVNNDRWIELNLFEQTTAVYDHGRLVFATLTTSGSKSYYTRPGLFQITEKLEVTPMRGAVEEDLSDSYYLEAVPWTMYFDERRAFHGEYWHDHLGYKSSHGCANLSFADAEWLYTWANLGDWVYVWDPSGKTPVIPELFTLLIGQDN
ncbi:MAG: L,D-transpeptidase family protein [Chloroflexota bacterium]